MVQTQFRLQCQRLGQFSSLRRTQLNRWGHLRLLLTSSPLNLRWIPKFDFLRVILKIRFKLSLKFNIYTVGITIVYDVGMTFPQPYYFVFTLHKIIWLDIGKVESRLSQALFERLKIVTDKDQTCLEPDYRADCVHELMWLTIYENLPSRINFCCHEIFFMNFDFKSRCKNKFKDKNEKSILKPDCHATAKPTAWNLNKKTSQRHRDLLPLTRPIFII